MWHGTRKPGIAAPGEEKKKGDAGLCCMYTIKPLRSGSKDWKFFLHKLASLIIYPYVQQAQLWGWGSADSLEPKSDFMNVLGMSMNKFNFELLR